MDKVANNEKISEAVKLINNRSYKEALECLKDILNETLEHEREAIKMYYALLELVQDQSVYLEEFARSMIGQEELHVLEVEKMLKEHN